LGQTRVAGVDVNQPRIRVALAAVLALGPSPSGFSVAQFTAKTRALTGPRAAEYTVRQAAYDLKKLRGKQLLAKRGARGYQAQPAGLRAIAALLTLRDQVIGPLLAGVCSPPSVSRPTTWTTLDQQYERLRFDMQSLFTELGIAA
jgi:hypothetical protein